MLAKMTPPGTDYLGTNNDLQNGLVVSIQEKEVLKVKPPSVISLISGSRQSKFVTDFGGLAPAKLKADISSGYLPEGTQSSGLQLQETSGSGGGFNQFNFPNLSQGASPLIKLRTPGKLKLQPADTLCIISGCCLFGAQGLVGITKDDKEISFTNPETNIDQPIITIRSIQCLSLSEYESVRRLAQSIAAIGNGASNVRVVFQIPREEYYLYFVKALQSGFITPNLYDELVQRVDERVEKVQDLVSSMLARYGTVEFPSALSSVRSLLLSPEVQTSAFAEQLSDAFAASSKIAKELVDKKSSQGILTPEELGKLSYAYLYINEGRRERSRALAVELSSEEGIAINVERKLGLEKTFALKAYYVMQRLLVTTDRPIAPRVTQPSFRMSGPVMMAPMCVPGEVSSPQLFFSGKELTPSLEQLCNEMYPMPRSK